MTKKVCWNCNHWIVMEGLPADPPDPAEPDWEYCQRGIGRSPFIEGCEEWQPELEIPTVGE